MTKHELEVVYQENFSSVYLYLLRLCQDKHLAEELTSDTFFKAMNAVGKFDGKCNLKSWLCQIAKYSYYDYIRKNKRFVEWNNDVEQNRNETSMEEQIINSIASKEICNELSMLEEPYKRVLILRVIEEFSFKQIAAFFGKTENWACVTYHRAKMKLKERMGKNEHRL